MPWPGPGSPSPGAATLGQRGDISLPGPWDCEAAPTSTLLEAIQIGAIQALFFFFLRKSDGIIRGRFLTRVQQVTSAFLDTLPYVVITHHSMFPLSDASFPLARPTPPSPTVASFLLTGCAAAARTRHPRKRVGVQPQVVPCYLSLLESLGSTPTSVSQTARRRTCICTARSLPRGCGLITCNTALSTTCKPDHGGIDETAPEIGSFLMHLPSRKNGTIKCCGD
jgi:hypothetical protein